MNKLFTISLSIISIILVSCSDSKDVEISYDKKSSVISYGITKLSEQLKSSGYNVYDVSNKSNSDTEICIISDESIGDTIAQRIYLDNVSQIQLDGYKIIRQDSRIFVCGIRERGCLYGLMDLIEQLRINPEINEIEERYINPALSFRAIKFNLPWAPYRPGPATDIHKETCRNLKYWESFMDMMVENRFNVLSLWSTHLFPYMIRARNYPKATPFTDEELDDWSLFWKALFRMAKDRGIDTYIVNWNIVTSPEFASHYNAKIHDDRSDLVIDYTRESVTQLINEYEDLTGLGVTLADWMGNWGDNKMTPGERENWIEATFVEGMKKANRKIKFIHRAVLAGDPREMRKVIDNADLPDKTIVEVKFNWSHGHSTPHLSITHANDQGTIMRDFWDPQPDNYFIAWMIRNEDFFVLRWGNPEFIRKHIEINNHEYVDGYFIGSEGYIPALDYSHMDHPQKTWEYAFEKQWFFYYTWGHLLYNPKETDQAISGAFLIRYKDVDVKGLLNAYSLASKVPLYIASFYKGTWDFTLYSEGFLAPWQNGYDDNKSPFISIEELIKHETLDSRYLSISEYCRRIINNDSLVDEGLINPMKLSSIIYDECVEALEIIDGLRSPQNDPALNSELDDLETWCNLGFYFSDKIRAGVLTELYNLTKKPNEKEKALEYLNNCKHHWDNVVLLTKDRYKSMPYVSLGHHQPRWPSFKAFHWKFFLKDVEADINYVMSLE
jgi:hypothetical protein